jgi:hypothetical protein
MSPRAARHFPVHREVPLAPGRHQARIVVRDKNGGAVGSLLTAFLVLDLAGFSIRRSDGRLLAAMPEAPLQPGPDRTLARSLGVPLDGAPPGRYEAIVVATDLAGRAAEAREPFEIEAPARRE